ncbi:MAG: xanthine dehydrogenase family protein subunit M [Lautropia sp.]
MSARLERPRRIDEAVALLAADPSARAIAGGQSLLPAIRLELATPSMLVDLSGVDGLDTVRVDRDALEVGAMCTHAHIAASALVRARLPGLARLAGGIADAQVRNLGTIGGSLANNDPAACHPAGVLACDATVVTDRREISSDAFFDGVFATTLAPDELVVAVRYPLGRGLRYAKFEQSASRFALVGVAVSFAADRPPRVAITGSGRGVFRANALETLLAKAWTGAAAAHESPSVAAAAVAAALPEAAFDDDLHASAGYRAHLAHVLAMRLLARGEAAP